MNLTLWAAGRKRIFVKENVFYRNLVPINGLRDLASSPAFFVFAFFRPLTADCLDRIYFAGCINGPRNRGRLEEVQRELGWLPLETDEDKKWVPLLLH